MGEIIGRLEQARSQIENKFSEAGSFLQETLELIGRQLEVLGNLGKILESDAVGGAAQDLVSTSDHLNALPALLASRDGRLRDIHRNNFAVGVEIREMRGLLRYLRAFALNVKITAAGMGTQASQFETYSQEMNVRIGEGEKLLDEFEADLRRLDGQVTVALQSEAHLASQAGSMLPDVPRRLSNDASAIGEYHKRVAQMSAGVASLAQRIQKNVLKTLSALQMGDIARQRIEHVQEGLATLAEIDQRLAQENVPEDARRRLDRHVCQMLAAQLNDIARDFDAEATRMLEHMGDMAADTQALLRLQQGGDTASEGDGLRSLEQSVANALVLVSAMDRASEGADEIQRATSNAVDNLVARVGSIKAVKDDVQYMALNTTLRCAHIGDAGKPLQVVATELSIYAKKLEVVADSTLTALQLLAQTTESRTGDVSTQSNVTGKLEASVARLRTAADVVEKDIGSATGQGRSLVNTLASAGEKLNFKAALLDVVQEAASALAERAGDTKPEVDDVESPLGEILTRISKSYTMAREREVHAMFAFEGGEVEVAEAAAAHEDDIEMFG